MKLKNIGFAKVIYYYKKPYTDCRGERCLATSRLEMAKKRVVYKDIGTNQMYIRYKNKYTEVVPHDSQTVRILELDIM